jgi:hypothetical protein
MKNYVELLCQWLIEQIINDEACTRSNASRFKCWVNFLLIPPKLGGKGAEINLRYPTN